MQELEVEYNKKYKMYMRTSKVSTDLFTLMDQRTYEPIFEVCKGAVMLDLGANIGAFTNNALRRGAKKVYAFEPDLENIYLFNMQKFNSKFSNVKLIEKAISNEDGVSSFYINERRNRTSHTLIPRRGRREVEVKTISFRKVMEATKPDIVKMDIEGAELTLKDFGMLKKAKYVAVEIHFDFKGTMPRAKKLVEFLRLNFEEITKESQSRVAMDKYGKLAFFIGRNKKCQ